jgi:hypothetical protein
MNLPPTPRFKEIESINEIKSHKKGLNYTKNKRTVYPPSNMHEKIINLEFKLNKAFTYEDLTEMINILKVNFF